MSDQSTTGGPRPLHGLRVIDLADEWGPLCGRLLGDFGADVVLVEPPGGSPARALPAVRRRRQSLWFLYRNFNKRGVVLDLDDDADRGRLLALLGDADVLIESTPGDSSPRAGSRRSRCHSCSPTWSSARSRRSGRPAPTPTTSRPTTWSSRSRAGSRTPASRPSRRCSCPVGAVRRGLGHRGVRRPVGAHSTAPHRPRPAPRRVGARVDDAAQHLGRAQHLRHRQHGGTANKLRSGNAPLYPHLRTKDGFIRLVLLAPRQWQAMWQWMGSPEALSDPMWATTFGRMQNIDVLNPVYEEFFATMTMEDAAAEAQRRGIVATPMLKPADVLENEHFVSRGTFLHADITPGMSAEVVDGLLALDGERMGFRLRAPAHRRARRSCLHPSPRRRRSTRRRPRRPRRSPVCGCSTSDTAASASKAVACSWSTAPT